MLKKFMSLLFLTALLVLSIVTSSTHAKEQTYATLLKGETFNEIIKSLATGHAVSGSVDDNTIKTIKRSYTEPSQSVDVMTGSAKTSDYLIKIWFDGTDTIYYYTEADKIYMNSNSEYLFRNLKALENLDLTTIDTSKVTNMKHMFINDIKISSLDLRSFDTSNVTNMHGMFYGCYSLTHLDLSSFNTSEVKYMQTMFYDLRLIESLDLSSFDTSKVTNMKSMFANNKKNSTNLTTIYVSNKFTTSSIDVEDNGSTMFTNDTKLVGGNGTKFNEGSNDKTYARIDAEGQPGYFTDKIKVKLIYIDDDSVIYTQTINKGEVIDVSSTVKTGYTTSYYEDSGAIIGFDIEQPITKYTEIYFNQSINKYTITFDTDGGNNIESITEDYGTPITAPENPIKDGYKFIGWNEEIPSTMPAENMTIKAKREKIKSNGGNGYSGGGNGGSRGDKSTDSNRDNTKDQSTDKEGDGSQIITGKNEELNINTCMEKGFSKEMCDTYNWAYNNGLTQYNNIKDARFNSQINRQEMAKISSIFVNKLFGKSPDTSKQDACSQFVDLNKVSSKMKPYIVQICELGYMGYKANGTDILEKFRPYASITLAEMSTTLSRIVWGNKYAGYGNKWYQGHLYAVYENNIIDNVNNPSRPATRWEVYNAFYKLYQLKHD